MRRYKEPEQIEQTPKQKATNIILTIIVFYDNYSKQEVFDFARKKMVEFNLENELTDDEIRATINNVLDHYVDEGLYEIDKNGRYQYVSKKVD